MITSFVSIIVLLCAFFWAFYRLPQVFFLNDEWTQIGNVFVHGLSAGLHSNILMQLTGKYRIIGAFINNLFFYYFPGNALPFIIFGYVFHTINIILAYCLAKKLTKSNLIAFICAMAIAVPTSGQQALSWLGAVVQTTLSVTLLYMAVLFRIKSLEDKKTGNSILSFVIAYIAFLIKNSSVFIFPLMIFFPYILKREKINFLQFLRKYIVYIVLFCSFLLWNIYFLFQFRNFADMATSVQTFFRIAFNSVWYPFISLSHMVVSQRSFFHMSDLFGTFLYQYLTTAVNKDIIVVTLMSDMISVFFSFIILAIILFVYWKMRERRGVLLFGVLWYVLSFVPMAVYLPERNTAFMESRYVYYSILGFGLVFGICAECVYLELKKRVTTSVSFVFFTGILALFYYKQIVFVQREVYQNVLYTSDIRFLIFDMNRIIPILPEKPILYITGDRNFFYQNNVVPFQYGTGFMTMIAFRTHEQIPKELISELYLSRFLEEGYRELNGKGYGYFWQKEALFDLFNKNSSLQTGQVIGLYYYGNERKLVDITGEIRDEISKNRRN